jgi:hypothetical protein
MSNKVMMYKKNMETCTELLLIELTKQNKLASMQTAD